MKRLILFLLFTVLLFPGSLLADDKPVQKDSIIVSMKSIDDRIQKYESIIAEKQKYLQQLDQERITQINEVTALQGAISSLKELKTAADTMKVKVKK